MVIIALLQSNRVLIYERLAVSSIKRSIILFSYTLFLAQRNKLGVISHGIRANVFRVDIVDLLGEMSSQCKMWWPLSYQSPADNNEDDAQHSPEVVGSII